MTDYIPILCNGFRDQLQTNWKNNEEINLLSKIRELNFIVTLSALFGNEIEKQDKQKLTKAFHEFDGWFEIASSNIPHFALTKFTNAKKMLLNCTKNLAKNYLEKPSSSPPLTAEVMRSELGLEGLENWLLALMWAGEANTIPVLFWSIYYLTENPEYLKRVENELNEKLNGKDISELSYKELMNIDSLKNALYETIRLHSPPIIVRGTLEPVKLKDYVVPKGHFICLSPFWIQRDENFYENATTWNPDRWNDTEKMKNAPFFAFGQGKYRCPGQSFAYTGNLIALSVLITTLNFEFPAQFSPPNVDMNNLVGVTKPLKDIKVRIYKK